MAFFQAKTLWVNQLADGVAALVLDRPRQRVNTIDAQVLEDLEAALAHIADGRFELLIVRSAKPVSFCHGLDLELLGSLHTSEEFVALAQRGQALCERLAKLPLPSVAVIAGNCRGAGLELALACDYRVVVDRPAVSLGLSPLDLGLPPAWGGSQRLARLIGLEHSLQLILGRRHLSPREALVWGLADDLAADADGEPPAFLAEPHKRNWSRFERRSWRQHLLEGTGLGRRLLLRGARRVLRDRVPEAMPAPAEAVEALRLAYAPGAPEPGLAHERLALGRLGPGTAARHLLDFRRQRRAQQEELARLAEEPHPRRIAVLGAGPASLNVLFQAITHGQEVVVRTQNEDELGTALMQLFRRLEAEARRGALSTAQVHKCLGGIRGTYTWTNFDRIDLALEAGDVAPEAAGLLREAASHAPPGTLLACGRATDGVASLQDGLEKPERLAGLYLVEPVGSGSLAEIVRGPATTASVERRLASWAASLGYTPCYVADRPGRLVLRVLWPALNEAVLLVHEGLSIARIDTALRHFGLAHGPLEYLDLLGLDVAAQLAPLLPPSFPAISSGITAMVQAGWLGKRTGIGFYHYRQGQRRGVHAAAETLWRTLSAEAPLQTLPAFSEADQAQLAVERVLALILLEAARSLDERVVPEEAALDLALCIAFWPPHRGGPIRFLREQQADLTQKWRELAQRYGPRFQPAPPAGSH